MQNKRTLELHFRVSKKELRKIEEKMKTADIKNKSKYLREAALSGGEAYRASKDKIDAKRSYVLCQALMNLFDLAETEGFTEKIIEHRKELEEKLWKK